MSSYDKRSVSFLILGWALQHAAYLFIDRKWEKDQLTIKTMTEYYRFCQLPLSVCI